MILVPCKIEETKRGWTDLKGLLTDFMNGDAVCVRVSNWTHKSATVCVRVSNWTHKSATVCRECLHSAVKRHYKGQIRVIKRGNDVYLAKTIAIK